jgi:hypothetical protein
MKNPALRRESRYEPAPVIPLKNDGSLLDWLREHNRLVYREEKIDIVTIPEEDEFELEEDLDFDEDFVSEDEDVEDTEDYDLALD